MKKQKSKTREYEPEECLKDIKKGDYFMLNRAIYKREEYDRVTKKYYVSNVKDIWGSGRLLKGNLKVRTDFIY